MKLNFAFYSLSSRVCMLKGFFDFRFILLDSSSGFQRTPVTVIRCLLFLCAILSVRA